MMIRGPLWANKMIRKVRVGGKCIRAGRSEEWTSWGAEGVLILSGEAVAGASCVVFCCLPQPVTGLGPVGMELVPAV